jgi:hypothetical protein
MQSAVSEMKRNSLQLTGLFARLVQKKITIEEANIEIMAITDALDRNAMCYDKNRVRLEQENRDLRVKNKDLHKEIYRNNEQVKRLETQIEKLDTEKTDLESKLGAFAEWQQGEDSFLLDASVASEQQEHQEETEKDELH